MFLNIHVWCTSVYFNIHSKSINCCFSLFVAWITQLPKKKTSSISHWVGNLVYKESPVKVFQRKNIPIFLSKLPGKSDCNLKHYQKRNIFKTPISGCFWLSIWLHVVNPNKNVSYTKHFHETWKDTDVNHILIIPLFLILI